MTKTGLSAGNETLDVSGKLSDLEWACKLFGFFSESELSFKENVSAGGTGVNVIRFLVLSILKSGYLCKVIYKPLETQKFLDTDLRKVEILKKYGYILFHRNSQEC